MPKSNANLTSLRPVVATDLAIFFEQQLDVAANHMAAFTAKDPTNKEAFMAKWAKILADETLIKQTILSDGLVAGNVVCHRWFGEPEVSYWLGKPFWGRGIATEALGQLLGMMTERPLFARVAQDNIASLRVLQKCGFVQFAEDRGFAAARGEEIAEFILRID